MPQLDLFAPSASRPAPSAEPARISICGQVARNALLPQRPIAWERLVERAGPLPVVLMAVTRWTRVVVETLSTAEGLRFLCTDGQIQERAPQEGRSRVIYYTPEALADLARRAPLVLIAEGTGCLTTRFARDGEAGCPDIGERLGRLS